MEDRPVWRGKGWGASRRPSAQNSWTARGVALATGRREEGPEATVAPVSGRSKRFAARSNPLPEGGARAVSSAARPCAWLRPGGGGVQSNGQRVGCWARALGRLATLCGSDAA